MQNPSGLDRRNFLKAGTGLAAAGLALANASAKAPEEYGVHWYPFLEHPDSDTCWSLSVGPDGRVYAAACAEGVPGGVALEAINHDGHPCALTWLGLTVVVGAPPRPPPT